jgi:hypothetical protein
LGRYEIGSDGTGCLFGEIVADEFEAACPGDIHLKAVGGQGLNQPDRPFQRFYPDLIFAADSLELAELMCEYAEGEEPALGFSLGEHLLVALLSPDHQHTYPPSTQLITEQAIPGHPLPSHHPIHPQHPSDTNHNDKHAFLGGYLRQHQNVLDFLPKLELEFGLALLPVQDFDFVEALAL